MINVGLIGYGVIAKVHQTGYEQLYEENKSVKLVAICDIVPENFGVEVSINIDVEGSENKTPLNEYVDMEEMLQKENLDMVDICLPTTLHALVAIDLLQRGYHVLCEKPMGKTYEDCLEMIKAANESGKKLMIGQCLHFFPEYEYLKEIIEDKRFGNVKSAFFQRLSPPPLWRWQNWFMNPDLSGGCLQDLHIHDLDMARYLFGEPESVSCITQDSYSKWDTAHTFLVYDDKPVTIIGDWSLQGMPFSAEYRVCFDTAAVVCQKGKVVVYPQENESFSPDIPSHNGYTKEIEYFVNMIEKNYPNEKNSIESSALSVKLVEALRESSSKNGKLIKFGGEQI